MFLAYGYYVEPRPIANGPLIVELEPSEIGLSQQNGPIYATRMSASTLNRRYHTPDQLKMSAESPKSSKTSGNTSRPLSYCGMTTSKMFAAGEKQMNDSMVESESHKKPSNGRNWADVNNSISSRMIAAASDSPPIIPKRDYHYSPGNSNTANRKSQQNRQMCDISTGEESDDTFNQRQQPHMLESQSSGGHNGSERGALMPYRPPHPGRMGFDQQGEMIYGPPPPHMGFLPPPPTMMGMPMGMFPPPPPMNFDPRGPPPFGHPMFTDQPGVLFTPFGPLHPGEMPDGMEVRGGGYNGKKKRRKEKLKRSRSLEFSGMFPPPPPPMMVPPFGFPPPPHMGPPMFPPMLGGPPPPQDMMMMGNIGDPHQLPYGHHQQQQQQQSNSDGNSQTTVDGGAIVPYVPLGSSQTHLAAYQADKLPSKYDLTSRKSSKANGHVFDAPPKLEKKRNGCYLLCCKGITQMIWIIIGIILIGVILGLVLGLTLV